MAVPTTTGQTAEEYKTAPMTATNQSGESTQLDTNTYTAPQTAEAAPAPTPEPAPEPTPAPVEAAPAPQPAPVPAALPQTASSVPMFGLIGLISMLGFFALRTNRVKN